MSSFKNDSFPTIGLNVPVGRKYSNLKTKKAWEYIYTHHLNDFDFFIKADTDTLILVENLREYLDTRDPNVPDYYGHRVRMPLTDRLTGSGLVLSRAAVKALIENAFRQENSTNCSSSGIGE